MTADLITCKNIGPRRQRQFWLNNIKGYSTAMLFVFFVNDLRPQTIPPLHLIAMSEPQQEQPAQDNTQIDNSHRNSHQPTSGINYFERAQNTQVRGGRFTSVGGSAYSPGTRATGPFQRPQQPSQSPSFFKDSSGTVVTDGDFTAISGDLHWANPPLHGAGELTCPSGFIILTRCWRSRFRRLHSQPPRTYHTIPIIPKQF